MGCPTHRLPHEFWCSALPWSVQGLDRPLFLGPGCMLVGSDDRAVNHQGFQIRSAPSTLMMPSHRPRLHQRLKRVYVVCQLPSSAGRSRHGEPVRAIHRTASINRRLSAAVTPLSLALPGNIASIFAHLLSLRSFLAILRVCGYAPQIIANDC